VIKVICGIGNPGERYRATRHNLGFAVIDRLAEQRPGAQQERCREFEYITVGTDYGPVCLIKPLTFVNRSGLAVGKALDMFGATPAELFVISDDYNLPLGRLRLRREGSAGGHNGLISILETMETTTFPRLRLGIGPLPDFAQSDRSRIPEFVLGRFTAGEIEIVDTMISRAVDAVEHIMNDRIDEAIRSANCANPTPEE